MTRLDRFIAENTAYSRAEAKRLIKAGRVSIGDQKCRLFDTKLNEQSLVHLDGQTIITVGKLYIQLHKPANYVSANSDDRHASVLDLLQDRARFLGSDMDFGRISNAKLQIVGRLDIDTTGLLLLTNDGDWNHRISAPKRACSKRYIATLAEPASARLVDIFASGIQLKSETKATLPAQLEIIDTYTVSITLHEGKYHQVKRMFAACNNRVISLHRAAIGSLELTEALPEGYFQLISNAERLVL